LPSTSGANLPKVLLVLRQPILFCLHFAALTYYYILAPSTNDFMTIPHDGEDSQWQQEERPCLVRIHSVCKLWNAHYLIEKEQSLKEQDVDVRQ
jgi:hypothetical protein